MDRLRGIFLVAISAVSFGLMPVFARMAYDGGLNTSSLLFLRFAVGAVFMLFLFRLKNLSMPNAKGLLIFLLMGAVGYAGQSFCYFTALKFASASTVSLLLYTYPVLVIVGAAIFQKEKVTFRKLLALACAMAGSVTIIGMKGHAEPLGIVLALGAALIYSGYILTGSRLIGPGMAVQSSAFIMIGATFVFGMMSFTSGYTPPINMKGFLGVGAIATVSTVLALWSFFAGLERIGPSSTALISMLEPVVTVLSSVLMLSETFSLNILVGGLLVVSSTLITLLPATRRDKH